MSIVVCLSGQGRSLDNLVQSLRPSGSAVIRGVIASRPDAGGLAVAASHAIEALTVVSRDYATPESLGEAVFGQAERWNADLVVLAGYLSLVSIPARMCNRVINIHPALLPAFGGQGMYGRHVHQAVLDHGCKISGCTVHFASNEYDAGPIILQATCPVKPADHPGKLAARVFGLECKALPKAVELLAAGRVIEWQGRTLVLNKAGKNQKATARSDFKAVRRWLKSADPIKPSPGPAAPNPSSQAADMGAEVGKSMAVPGLPSELEPFGEVCVRNPLYLLGRWGIESAAQT